MIRYKFLILFLLCLTSLESFSFIENKGQWDDSILFLHQTTEANYWICKDRIVYDSFKMSSYNEDSIIVEGFASEIRFDGMNPRFSKVKQQNPEKQSSNKLKYLTIILEDYYPNIDLRLTDSNGKLRFDFLCNERSKPNDIRIILPDRDKYLVSNSFAHSTNKYSLVIDSLRTYSSSGNVIESKFKFQKNVLSIDIPNPPKTSYVIDPIIYSTFLGGSSYEYARDVAVYRDNIFTVGYTSSTNFPTTFGAYTEFLKTSEAGETDIVISKFNSKGDSLLASTYFGSYFNDFAESVCIDSLGNVYIAGYFESNSTFPISNGAADSTLNEGYEGFVACFDSNLTTLKYSTLISGEADDFPQKIQYLHEQKKLAVCGYTYSHDSFPKSDKKHLSRQSLKADAFLMSLSTDLKIIEESAVWGGEDDDFCHDFIFSNGIYSTVGYSMSNTFPLQSTDTTFIQKQDSLYGDAFITQLNLQQQRIENSIILSGIKKDIAYSISELNDSLFSIAGYTESINFPVTPNAYDTEYSNGISETKGDGFVAKFKADLTPVFISFFGGAETDRVFDCGHDSKGNTYLVGSTYSIDFPVKGPYINNTFADTSGNSDAFIAKINSTGEKLLYSTYLGGTKIDIAKAIYVQANDYAIVTGWTSSPDFPVQAGSLDTVHNNHNMADIFSLKILPSRIEFEEGNELFLCDLDTIDIHTVLYDFDVIDTTYWVPDYNISDTKNISTTIFPDSSTVYTLFVRDTTGFIDSASIAVNIIVFPENTITGPDKVKPDIEYEYSVSDKPYITYDWQINAGEIISKVDSNSIKVKWNNPYEGSLKLYYLTDYGCLDSANAFSVTYDTIVKPHITPITKTKVCKGVPVIFDAGAGYKAYQWSTGSTTRFDTVYSAGLYWAVLRDDNNVIHFTDSVFVTLMPLPQIPSVSVNGNILTSTEEDLSYQWYLNGTPIPHAIKKSYTAIEDGFYQIELRNKNNCTNISDSTYVTVTSVAENSNDFSYIFVENLLELKSNVPFAVNIYNIMGEEIYNSNKEHLIFIDLSEYAKGVYFAYIRFLNSPNIQIIKLLKY